MEAIENGKFKTQLIIIVFFWIASCLAMTLTDGVLMRKCNDCFNFYRATARDCPYISFRFY